MIERCATTLLLLLLLTFLVACNAKPAWLDHSNGHGFSAGCASESRTLALMRAVNRVETQVSISEYAKMDASGFSSASYRTNNALVKYRVIDEWRGHAANRPAVCVLIELE